MPTSEHELPLEMVRNRQQLIPVILRTVFGLDMPADGLGTLRRTEPGPNCGATPPTCWTSP